MSGTLYPPKMYADLLGIGQSKTTSRQYESPFASQRRPIVVAKDVTTRYQDRSYQNTERIRAHIQSLCDASPGHVAVFTPSYSMLNEYIGEGQFQGVVVRMEDRTWSKQDVDQLLDVLEDAKQVVDESSLQESLEGGCQKVLITTMDCWMQSLASVFQIHLHPFIKRPYAPTSRNVLDERMLGVMHQHNLR